MKRNRVLLVSYIFPPSGGVGVQRALSYTRFLPDSGCEVFVLAARGGSCPVSDPDLLRLVPPTVPVCRTFTPEPSYALRNRILQSLRPSRPSGQAGEDSAGRSSQGGPFGSIVERLFSPDPQVVWTPFAIRAADRLIRKHDIGTVLVTVPPFSALQVGVEMKRRFPGIRLISDFRDEWVGYYLVDLNAGISSYRLRLAERKEREAVEASDFVIAITPTQRDSIHSRYPAEPDGKFLSITNGYDPEMFRGFTSRSAPKPDGAMTIAHVGTVYANKVYSPKPYFDALASLPDDVRSRIETVFIGRVASDAEALLDQPRCRVRKLGFLPQHEALSRLEGADAALLVCNSMTSHSGKVFEYLATGKRILTVASGDSEVARIVREAGTGIVLDPADPARMRAGILEAFHAFSQGVPPKPDWDRIHGYQRPRLVAELARLTGIVSANAQVA